MKTSVEDLVQSGVDVVTTLGDKGVNLNFAADSATALLPAGARETARRRVPLRPRHLLQNKFIPAYILKKTIDPTGAGDAWRGGFMAGLLAGKTVEESLAMGNATASFAVESYGTVNYRIKKAEFNKRLKAITISKK